MTLRVKPPITVSVTKKANGRLILNYTRPERTFVSECQDIEHVSSRQWKSSKTSIRNPSRSVARDSNQCYHRRA